MTALLKSARAKLFSVRGDTLVEALAAILIAALAATLLATMVIASVNVTASSEKALASTYAGESGMLLMPSDRGRTITIELGSAKETVNVDVYRTPATSGNPEFMRYENTNERPAEDAS